MAHASWLEVLWLIMACVGFTCSLLNATFARADAKRYRRSIVPSDQFFFRIVYVSARLTLIMGASVVVVAAVLAVIWAPPPPDYREVPQTLSGVICWTIVALYFAIHQSLGLYWRRKLNLGDYGGKTYPEIERRHPVGPSGAASNTETPT